MSNTETKVMAEEAEHGSSSIRASVALPPLNPQGREVGVGIGMGNTCKSMADSCQCMAKTTIIL